MKYLSILLATAVVAVAGAGQAMANSSRVNPPPIVLSPNLTSPWVNQLQPGYKVRKKRTRRRSIFTRERRAPSVRRKRQRSLSSSHNRTPQPVRIQQSTQRQIASQFLPTVVDYQTKHKPGTVIIDTAARHLYLVETNGRARRYGVGVGKQGFAWSGTERITRKAEWPAWRPPAQMIAREKRKGRHLPKYMPGGPNNPLGARALYLGSTLYRIHGSNQPWSIGQAVSSGCIRMRNEDVSDFYNRVGVGTKVVVL